MRGRRVAAGIAGVVVGGLLVGLAPSTFSLWRGGERFVAVADAPDVPVALVLGAQVYANGTPSAFLAARLDRALELYRAGSVQAIIVSGTAEDYYDEPAVMRRWLEERGVAADRIVDDGAGYDTYDSCVRARDVFGLESVVVVTQRYHAYRAVATCRAIGLDAYGAVDDSVADRFPDTWWYGVAREIPANWKMVIDVVTSRTPELGPDRSSEVAAATRR